MAYYAVEVLGDYFLKFRFPNFEMGVYYNPYLTINDPDTEGVITSFLSLHGVNVACVNIKKIPTRRGRLCPASVRGDLS